MLKTIALSAVGVAALEAPAAKKAFVDFMKDFDKQYEAEELGQRFEIFKANLNKIEEHNAKGESWTMKVTQFTDLSEDEFSALFKGYNDRNRDYVRSQNLHVNTGADLGDDPTIDWVSKGAVTPIKDQAQCGSCWAFSTTGGTEGANFVTNNQLISLSEQQLVDCAGNEGNQGCNGGLMDDAFEYIIKNGGIGTESDYPYKGTDGMCKSNVKSAVSISGYKDVAKGNEGDLMDALNQQPVSIAVDAGSNWQMYGGGVLKHCFGKKLDHGVLLVGAGTDGSTKYWKVKNSWGKSWGEQGYIRLKRGMDSCGLADAASYPTI